MNMIYVYHPTTFEYGYSIDLDEVIVLPPANSTSIPLPEEELEEGHVWVYDLDNTEWYQEVDIRGTKLYSIADGSAITVTELGPEKPEGYVDVAPPDYPAVYPTQYTWDDEEEEWVVNEQAVNDDLAAKVRLQRNALLAETDFVMLDDVPIDEICFADTQTYRQALRDIPEQNAFPNSVTWPTRPPYVKMAS